MPETSTPNPTPHRPNTPVPQTGITSSHIKYRTAIYINADKKPWALYRLLPYNQPGLKELIPPQRPLPMRDGRKGDVE